MIYPNDNLREFGYAGREMCSDVFIFENSGSHEQYVLAILKGDNVDAQDYSNFTFDILSFIDIDVKEIPEPDPIASTTLKSSFPLLPAGPVSSHLFPNSPQFAFTLNEEARIQIKAESEGASLMLTVIEGGQ